MPYLSSSVFSPRRPLNVLLPAPFVLSLGGLSLRSLAAKQYIRAQAQFLPANRGVEWWGSSHLLPQGEFEGEE